MNQIANLAIVGWEVNGQISDEAPYDYWPVWVQKYGKGPDDLAEMQFWHALPEGWQSMDYHQFLAARRQLMAQGHPRRFRATFLAGGTAGSLNTTTPESVKAPRPAALVAPIAIRERDVSSGRAPRGDEPAGGSSMAPSPSTGELATGL